MHRRDNGFLTPAQRRGAWFLVLLMTAYAPVVARVLPDDSWLLSLTVGALVAFTIVMDDVQRRRRVSSDIPTDGE